MGADVPAITCVVAEFGPDPHKKMPVVSPPSADGPPPRAENPRERPRKATQGRASPVSASPVSKLDSVDKLESPDQCVDLPQIHLSNRSSPASRDCLDEAAEQPQMANIHNLAAKPD